ncbi:sigma factor-like helix-turn-helix DNA-binding protein [Streptococcus suis]|uniref:sigma factor-like helix-turn-helix DNA-binding protein n=1 Tax=Streptococcus suis TaxID=1307 RepID=UPI0038BC7610
MKYYIYVKGKRIPVGIELYKSYWKLVNHEKYLRRREVKFSVRPFSDYENEGFSLEDVIVDKSIDVEKVIETKLLLEALLEKIFELNAEEILVIEGIYFKEKTLKQVAIDLQTSPATIMRLRDRILRKLRNMLENSQNK